MAPSSSSCSSNTAATLTPANVSDAKTALELLESEAPGLEILADAAYGSAATRAELRDRCHDQLIRAKPLPVFIVGGFTRDDFDVDHSAGTVTCPAGHEVTIAKGRWATFGARCGDCTFRARCTRSSQGVRLEIICHDVELVAARRQRKDPEALARFGVIARWSSAPSPYSWPTGAVGSAIAGSFATSWGCRCEWPRSICVDSSTWVSSTTGPAGSRPAEGRANSGRQRGTALWPVPTWVANFNPLRVVASVGQCPEFATLRLRLGPGLFNCLLGGPAFVSPHPGRTLRCKSKAGRWVRHHITTMGSCRDRAGQRGGRPKRRSP